MHTQPFTDLRTSKRQFLATLGLIGAVALAAAGTLVAAAPGVTVAVTGDIYTAEAKVVSDVKKQRCRDPRWAVRSARGRPTTKDTCLKMLCGLSDSAPT